MIHFARCDQETYVVGTSRMMLPITV